jgi:eukaryotic-like serine/threonine-protein kinase
VADNPRIEIGRYHTLELLGEGATGAVYRAADGEREVALKVLRSSDPVAARRFEREARLAAAARSRHLVPVLEHGEGYVVMPLYRGGSLATRLRREGPQALRAVVDLAAQLGRGLDSLHEQGVIHRDVKPSNVLLDETGTAALSDFGVARGEGSTQLTREGQLVGTLHYLAPELIEGAPASSASDIYALGCLLYECLTGAPPFSGRADAELGYAHLVEPPPDPRTRRPDLPDDAGRAVLTALAKKPSQRPTSATALARMLHLAHRSEPVRPAAG